MALLHLTPGLDGVSKAVNECERGMLPETPTICVGQPHALDPSRCPEGAGILWLQLPEAPRAIKGDAAGKIGTPPDGRWSEPVREAYADRVEAILANHIDGFRENMVARCAYSPADLEAMNINLVGGDPYGGSCEIAQSFIWRPFANSVNHATTIRGPLPDRRFDPSRRRASPAAPASRWRSGCDEPGAGRTHGAGGSSRRTGSRRSPRSGWRVSRPTS